MGRIIEGLWDCKYCGKTEIGGSQKKCPVCGKQRDENIKFYLKGEKKYISDEEAKKVSRNPDWLCPYCSNLNSDNDNKCSYCGASRDGTEKDYFENRAEKDKEETLEPIEHRLKDIYGTDFSDEDELEDEEQSADDYYNDYHNKRESKKSKSLSVNWGILGFSSIFVVMIGLLIAFLIPKNADLVIIVTPTNDDENHIFDTSAVEDAIEWTLKVNPDVLMVIKSTFQWDIQNLYVKSME